MSTLICFALKEEAAPFQKVAAGGPGILTLIVGIGRQNAENSLRRFLDSASPQLVLSCGFAGGLNSAFKLGDVVFELRAPRSQGDPSRRGEEAGTFRSGAHELGQKLASAGAKPASFWCADHIATTAAEKQQLRRETGADAVEMESAAIHALCRERGIPCATVRVISDTASEDLPLDFNALSKPDQSLDFGKLAWALARSPGKIGELLALQKKTSFAAKQLAAVLEKLVVRPPVQP